VRLWYVARVKRRQEQQVLVVLGHKQIETYFPLLPAKRRRGVAEPAEPLFPGYMFARLDAETPEWVETRSAPGVVYFLGADRVPTAVPDILIEEIRERVRRQSSGPPVARYRPGQKVKIIEGPFDGLEAIFDGTLSSTGRSRVLVMIVGRLAPVQIDVDSLASAD
jgi:transcriptional antiterminator RfaH